jgi:hypothetical protein
LLFSRQTGALPKNGPKSGIESVFKWTHKIVTLCSFGNNKPCLAISKKNAHIGAFHVI